MLFFSAAASRAEVGGVGSEPSVGGSLHITTEMIAMPHVRTGDRIVKQPRGLLSLIFTAFSWKISATTLTTLMTKQ